MAEYSVVARIERAADGVVRDCQPYGPFNDVDWTRDGYDEPHPAARYWFTEGNGECDCNRSDFFADAGADEREPRDAGRCSSDRFLLHSLTEVGQERPFWTREQGGGWQREFKQ